MPSTITRKDIRNAIRQNLESWPVIGKLKQDIQIGGSTLNIEDDLHRDYVNGKTLLEVDSEVMTVVDVPESSPDGIRVLRGAKGSTEASHAKLASVKIFPSWGWTDFELNQRIIPAAIRWLRPHAWKIVYGSDFTWSSATKEKSAPSGISYPDGNYIVLLQHKDSSGRYFDFYGWHLIGGTINFREQAAADRTLRAVEQRFQANLTDDTTALDNDDFEQAIVLYACHLAMNSLKTNRVRFAEYAAALNDRTSTPDELIRMAFDFKNQAVIAREEAARQLPPGFAKTYSPASP